MEILSHARLRIAICAGATGALVLAAVAAPLAAQRPRSTPTPAPTFTDPLGVPRSAFLAYARSLDFDENAGDAQYLPALGGARAVAGPYARIAPEDGAYALDTASLAQGRVIGRIVSDGPYPRLGISSGVTYMWAENRGTGWRWLMIPENDSQPVFECILEAKPFPSYMARQSFARWIINDPAAAAQPGGGRRTPDIPISEWIHCPLDCCGTSECTPLARPGR